MVVRRGVGVGVGAVIASAIYLGSQWDSESEAGPGYGRWLAWRRVGGTKKSPGNHEGAGELVSWGSWLELQG